MSRAPLRTLLGLLALPLIVASVWLTFENEFSYALLSFIGVVAVMETRVLVGGRSDRDWFFYLHLVSSIYLLGTLILLLTMVMPPLASTVAKFSAALSCASGFVLLLRTPRGA